MVEAAFLLLQSTSPSYRTRKPTHNNIMRTVYIIMHSTRNPHNGQQVAAAIMFFTIYPPPPGPVPDILTHNNNIIIIIVVQ